MGHPALQIPRPRRLVALVSTVTFLGFIDTYLLIPVLSLYAVELGAATWMAGVIVASYSIINTGANIPFGRIVDKIGRRTPLIIGLAVDALSLLLYAVTSSPTHLLLVRIMHGLSGALIGPATMALMADYAPPLRRGRQMGFYGAALGLTVLAGFMVSGLATKWWGFHGVFYVGSALLAVGALISFMLPRDGPPFKSKGKRFNTQDLAALVRLLRSRNLLGSYSALFMQIFTLGAVTVLFPLYVVERGMTSVDVAILLTVFAAVFVAVQLPCGALSDRVGRRTPAAIGLASSTIALSLLPGMQSWTLWAAAMVLYGGGYGLLFPSISALVTDNVAEDQRGLGMGIFHAMLTAGAATGAISMAALATLTNVGSALAATSTAAAIGVAVLLLLVREAPRNARTQSYVL